MIMNGGIIVGLVGVSVMTSQEAHNLLRLVYLQVDNGTRVETAALYNLTDNTYQPFHITESPLCSGHVLLQDGSAYVVGGAHFRSPLFGECFECPMTEMQC